MVEQWVKDIVSQEMPSSMQIGKVLQHPDGRTVKIVDGQLWGTHGFSNSWSWQEVLPDGTLGPVEHGYGW